jgi:hypothetical protein
MFLLSRQINTAVGDMHNASAALIFERQGTGCRVEVKLYSSF